MVTIRFSSPVFRAQVFYADAAAGANPSPKQPDVLPVYSTAIPGYHSPGKSIEECIRG